MCPQRDAAGRKKHKGGYGNVGPLGLRQIWIQAQLLQQLRQVVHIHCSGMEHLSQTCFKAPQQQQCMMASMQRTSTPECEKCGLPAQQLNHICSQQRRCWSKQSTVASSVNSVALTLILSFPFCLQRSRSSPAPRRVKSSASSAASGLWVDHRSTPGTRSRNSRLS